MNTEILPAASRLSGSAKWFVTSIFVTNIGNGMQTIAVGKLLYDKTGSAASFGFVMIAEYVISFLAGLIAGSAVDRGSCRGICISTDVFRSLIVLSSCAGFAATAETWWIVASIIGINLGKPFYRSATFVLGARLSQETSLLRLNAVAGAAMQTGQLLGMGLVGLIITYTNTTVAFGLNGLSYAAAAVAITFVTLKPLNETEATARQALRRTSLADEWRGVFSLLKSERGLLAHICICAGDFVAIAFLNLALVPIVSQWYGGDAYIISLLDGCFAVGAAAVAFILRRWKASAINMVCFGLIAQSVLFGLLAAARSPYAGASIILLLGGASTLSLTASLSALQTRCGSSVKGKIAAARQLILSLAAAACLSIVTSAHSESLVLGLLSSSAICAAFGFSALILSRTAFLGKALLGNGIN